MSPKYKRRRTTEAIILHHSAGPRDQSVDVIRGYHKSKGWIDVGYNFLVRQGVPHEGRPVWAQGAHAPGWNFRSVGICIVGDYRQTSPYPEDLEVAAYLCRTILQEHPQALILGHSEAMALVGKPRYTSCPGPFIVEEVRQRMAIDSDSLYSESHQPKP